MADKTANMTVVWTLTSTFTVPSSTSADSEAAKLSAVAIVSEHLINVGPHVQQISLEDTSVNYMLTLTGEGG